jgi:hypothetical protein
MKTSKLFTMFLFLLASATILEAQTGVLSIVVKDSNTNSAVQAKVRIEGPQALESETDKNGNLTLSLPAGEYQVTAASLGYRSVTWRGILRANATAKSRAEIFLFPASAETPATGGIGVLSIRIRDTITHYAVRATVELEGPKSLSVETGETGETGRVSLPSGEYLWKITAPGYKTMWWNSVVIRSGDTLPLTVNLDSSKPRDEEEWERAQLKPGYTLFRGYATDERGLPVAGVHVSLKDARIETTTNGRGYYSFLIPTPHKKAGDLPGGTDTLVAEKAGYKTIVHQNIVLAGEDSGGSALDMTRGSGTEVENDLPMVSRPTDEHQHPDHEQPGQSSPQPPNGARETSPRSSPVIGASLVPPSITVGLACKRDPCQSTDPQGYCYHTDCTNYRNGCAACRLACTDPEPFNLETYVGQGLQFE